MKVSIIIPTLGRETLYPLIENLLTQKVDFSYEIVLIPQIKLKDEFLQDNRIRVYYEPAERGFAYYRNVGIQKATGEILAFIDDDELPMDLYWLDTITSSIINGQEKVITAGSKIELGQGYWADCVSLLGFPGGGAVGFRTMWTVMENDYTTHLCSGNFAIPKDLLLRVGNFDVNMVNGSEDVGLAGILLANDIRIKYMDEATVFHAARKGFVNFMKWNILRGKSARQFMVSNGNKGKVLNRFESSLRILGIVIRDRPVYLFGVILMMVNQYLLQTVAYLRSR